MYFCTTFIDQQSDAPQGVALQGYDMSVAAFARGGIKNSNSWLGGKAGHESVIVAGNKEPEDDETKPARTLTWFSRAGLKRREELGRREPLVSPRENWGTAN
jgi:hypothetical protein